MKYVVTGGSGFIGSALCRRLDLTGHEVVNLDLNSDPSVDLRQSFPIIRADCVIHLAAITNIRESISAPLTSYLDNIQMTARTLDAARKMKCPLTIFVSSCAAPSSSTPYAASKLAGESLCQAYRKTFGMTIATVRLSSVFGPFSRHKKSVVATFMKNIIDKKPLRITGDGTQARDFIYVDDAVLGILRPTSIDVNLVKVATGVNTEIIDLVSLLTKFAEQYLNYTPSLQFVDEVKGEIHTLKISPDFKVPADLEGSLEITFKWFLDNYG